MPRQALVDQTGKAVRLGKEIGRGGEGEVYLVETDPTLVAKVYTKRPDAATEQKVRELVRLVKPDLLRVAALPTATLHEGAASNPVRGVLMPLVPLSSFRPVHYLYSPAQRRSAFPAADWSFLMHTARNCASAFERLHSAGLVVGDVNHSNLLVDDKTDVRLIDCDSFQVRTGSAVLRCNVGVPEFTPPELQGQRFDAIDREPNHDNFGLAVLLFHLLFMGRHPYSGIYRGPGDMPLEKAIGEHRFAYGPDAGRYDVVPPPLTLPLDAVTPEVAALFSQAFRAEGTKANGRPSAATWKATLSQVIATGFATCGYDVGHVYPKASANCPWCQLMSRGAPNFFLTVSLSRGQPATPTGKEVDVAALWKRVESYALPRRVYQRPMVRAPKATPLPADVPTSPPDPSEVLRGCGTWVLAFVVAICVLFMMTTWGWWICFTVLLGVLFGVAFLVAKMPWLKRHDEQMRAYQAERKRREERLERAEYECASAEHRLAAQSFELVDRFNGKKQQWRQCYDERQALPTQMGAERKRLEGDAREAQLEEYLEQFLLQDAVIDKIGTGRKATLRSFGIETAADIQKAQVMEVPGFGEKLTQRLLTWRKECGKGFQYDAAKGVPAARLAALTQKYANRQRQLEEQLRIGADELERLVTQTRKTLDALESGVRGLVQEVAQAEQDVTVFG